MDTKNLVIQAVFIGKPQYEAGWPYLGYDPLTLEKTIMDHLHEKFPDVTVKKNEIITTYDKRLNSEIINDVQHADGLLIFTIGHYGDPGLIQSAVDILSVKKIPTVLANLIYAGDHTFVKLYTSIKDKGFFVYPVSSRRIEDFDKSIGILFDALGMKGKKILTVASDTNAPDWNRITGLVTPEISKIAKTMPVFLDQVTKLKASKFEFFTDLKGVDQAHQWRKDEKLYVKNLQDVFGVGMQREDPMEIVKYYDQASEAAAKPIAEKWTKQAKLVEPAKQTIVNSARLYIGLKKLMEDKKVHFLAPDCGTLLLIGKMPAYPCMGFFELTNDGCYGICESDMDAAISYMFGEALSKGRPGFVSNHTIDLSANQITYMHCVAANRLLGINGPAADFDIVHHGETGIIGASPRVKFPIGESFTTIKISVFAKKMALYVGKIIDNVNDKGGCVTKVLVQIKDARKLLETYDWETFGWHRVSFVGDWQEQFKIGARLLGLELFDYSSL
nr:hypothetical protein [Candidatus Sigynarchaeota archaeon]